MLLTISHKTTFWIGHETIYLLTNFVASHHCRWAVCHYDTIWIEPICCQHNMYIMSLFGFLMVNDIKVFPCFTIGYVHHLDMIVSFDMAERDPSEAGCQ